MRLLVESSEDPASVTIAEALRDTVDWEPMGLFNQRRILAHEDWRLIHIDEMHLTSENLHQRLPPSLIDPDLVVFLSRHKSASGEPTLSVHPIGNFTDAPYGGRPRSLVPSHPAWMAGIFEELVHRDPADFEVTYEATHHGPFLESPTLFYELGSTEEQWEDEQAADLLAHALLDAKPSPGRNVLWVGGGHYCPQLNDAVRASDVRPGHIIPGWAIDEGIGDEALRQTIEAVPDCEGYVLQPEATKAEREVAQRLEAMGVDRIEIR